MKMYQCAKLFFIKCFPQETFETDAKCNFWLQARIIVTGDLKDSHQPVKYLLQAPYPPIINPTGDLFLNRTQKV